MSYESYTLGTIYNGWGKPTRAQQTPGNPTDSKREPITANLGDLNPFGWALD